MRNKIFQTLWFAVRYLFPRKTGTGLAVGDYAVRIVAQLLLARLFGGPDLVLIGDSNSEAFSNEKDMARLSDAGVACGLGIGGTRGDQWVIFFRSRLGRLVMMLIGDAHVIWNIGGNHVLQKQMGSVSQAYADLRALFPSSRIILIPPIHYSILRTLGLPEDETRENVRIVNQLAREEWGQGHCIDLYQTFLDHSTGEAYPLILADMVHYGPLAREIIVRVILAVIGGAN